MIVLRAAPDDAVAAAIAKSSKVLYPPMPVAVMAVADVDAFEMVLCAGPSP